MLTGKMIGQWYLESSKFHIGYLTDSYLGNYGYVEFLALNTVPLSMATVCSEIIVELLDLIEG